MSRGPGSLTAADAALLSQAFGLLQRGHAREATVVANDVAARAPRSADALHLVALCSKALGDDNRAVAAFEAARVLAPSDVNLLGNYANLLCRMGRFAQAIDLYRHALALAPTHGEGWMNLGLALIDSGDAKGAREALERAVQLRPTHSSTWQALGAAKRSLGDLDGAEAALRRAISLDPDNGAAWTSLGVVRRLLGDPTDSLACYAQARRAGFAGPEIDDAEASAHLDLGDPALALEGARRLTASAPAYVPGHAMLARLLWEHGAALSPREDARAVFRNAVASQPSNHALRIELIRFLIEAGAADEALVQIRSMRSVADVPALVLMEARALEALDERDAAGKLFSSYYPAMRNDAGFLNFYVRHLLKTGEPALAAARAAEALEHEPFNQAALAYLGLAWRLTGDAREDWLCDYEGMIAEVTVDPPRGFADEASFLRALEGTLLQLHKAHREPLDQSLRNGSQTSGMLFGGRDPVVCALRDACANAVLRYVGRLPEDASHPFLQRKSSHIRFAGSWSVRLWSAGRHINHFHQEGWISSAFYVSLPPSVLQSNDANNAGCIQFGEPPVGLGLGLGPRRVIRPRVGRLVLFPSYVWHGTVPFHDDTPRLTVAFDAIPSG